MVKSVNSREYQISHSQRPSADADAIDDGFDIGLVGGGEEVQVGLVAVVIVVSQSVGGFHVGFDEAAHEGSREGVFEEGFGELRSSHREFLIAGLFFGHSENRSFHVIILRLFFIVFSCFLGLFLLSVGFCFERQTRKHQR